MSPSKEPARRGRWSCPIGLAALFVFSTAAVASTALTLEDAVALAEREAPELQARRAAADAAELMVRPAGQLPDPELLIGIDNLPVDGPDRGSLNNDFMTMRRIGLMQAFPRRAKREARVARAAAEAELKSAERTVAELTVREAVARAWIAAYSAERRAALLGNIRPQLDAQVIAADAALAAGRGSAAEGLAARSLRGALEDRSAEAERDVIVARTELERWLPELGAQPLASAPDFTRLDRASGAIVAAVGQHRGLLTLDAEAHAVAADLALAEAEKRSDWAVEVAYAERGPAFSNMLSVGVRIGLPIFASRRQEPAIAARRADLERFNAERETMRREHVAQLHAAVALWNSARQRVERNTLTLLPLAEDRAAVALAAYRGGRGPLSDALAALSDVVEQQLAAVDRLADLGNAWASLHYAFVQEP